MTPRPVLFSMAKSNSGAQKSKTHFEQVPLEVVKKIADQRVSKDNETGTARVRAEPTARKKG